MDNKKRILVIEDEVEMAEMIKMRLEANNYQVINAYNGQQGLEMARSQKPDLIVLDIMLPKLDGYKICGLLKNDVRYALIPIIMFTARAQEKDMNLGKELGADAYIVKPLEPKALLSKIRELLKE